MRPELIDWQTGIPFLDRLVLPSYFTMLALAFAVGFILTRRHARTTGQNVERMTDLAVYVVIFSIIGARMAHVLFDGMLTDYVHVCLAPHQVSAVGLEHVTCISDDQCRVGTLQYVCDLASGHCHPGRDCLAAFRAWQGGLTYYGGLILAFAFAYAYVKRHRLKWGPIMDLYGFLLPLGLTFGRMGCFLNGCCFGRPTNVSWAARFPAGSLASWEQFGHGQLESRNLASLPAHPTQIYSALANLAIFFIVYLLVRPNKRYHGQMLVVFLSLYAVARFLIEFLRADQRGGMGPLSTSQIISLGMLVLAGLIHYFMGRYHVSEAGRLPSAGA